MNPLAIIAVSGIAGLAVTFIMGFSLVPFLGKIEFGRTYPAFEKKQPAPSMGGILLAIGTVSAVVLSVATDKLSGGDIISSGSLIAQEMQTKFWSGLFMALSFALIGLTDDFYKIKTNGNIGLTVKQKTVMQFFVILAYLTGLYMGMNGMPYMFVPFYGNAEPGFFYWIIGFLYIYAAVNAVNITDGIDGLCGSVTFTAAVSLGVVAALKGLFGLSAMSAALAGSCTGFLLWNKHPAKILEGKTGTMFLSGMLVAISYATGCPFILILSGISYFVNGASDFIRVAYYKRTGKNLFGKSAPLQHHLKYLGWNDKKIVLTFTAVNIIGGVAAVAVMYYGGYILI